MPADVFSFALVAGGELLPSHNRRARSLARKALTDDNVDIIENDLVIRISRNAIALASGRSIAADAVLISTKADTKDAAGQMAMGTIIPSIFLSGYVFPLDSMPDIFKTVAYFIPTTWLIDASRGIILRGTDWGTLWKHATVLWLMAIVVTVIAAVRMRKQVG